MYVELQKEIQAFYPRAPDLAVSKCLKRISIKSSPDILTEVYLEFGFRLKFLGCCYLHAHLISEVWSTIPYNI